MKNFIKYSFIPLFGAVVSCTYDFPADETQVPTAGEANFAKMVVIGDGIAAGFMDGALYDRGQGNSFAVRLAEQMSLVDGGAFTQPSINSVNGYYGMGPNNTILGRLILKTTNGVTSPAPIGPGELPTAYGGNKAELNNFSAPSLTLGLALIPQTGGPNVPQNPAFNPYYARFASNPGASTPIGDAAQALGSSGTFFSFWLGSSDVLGYAIGGASNPLILTSDSDFTQRYSLALGAMLSANPDAKGAVANIPNLNVLPYFNLVPWNALPLDQGTAAAVNQGFAAYNGGLVQLKNMGLINEEERVLRTINFVAGQNGFLMSDESLTDLSQFGLPSIRQSKASDKATLTLAQALGQPIGGNSQVVRGVSYPVEDVYVLTPAEQTQIQTKIDTFNGIISAAVQADAQRLVLVDINAFLNRVLQGQVNFGGAVLNASIIPPNGGFSVDGVHPNGRAHGFIANEFINAINAKWGSNIPLTNPNAIPGNDIPVQ
ncbi:hypothetical protein J0A67_07445 [Algoriphagus aestuariicola]|uniref:G-D-S-L family lipolytic protein n=1 Tax=Algoriphagus aestuariicola TaxID=1852016 RepID=A0ABS3BPD5_9BACT|nr:hypothetical protein [Algoriphagus aestuariicola]MBN7800689.1 hypothetical protein [Algoriphagus aestuariicola]